MKSCDLPFGDEDRGKQQLRNTKKKLIVWERLYKDACECCGHWTPSSNMHRSHYSRTEPVGSTICHRCTRQGGRWEPRVKLRNFTVKNLRWKLAQWPIHHTKWLLLTPMEAFQPIGFHWCFLNHPNPSLCKLYWFEKRKTGSALVCWVSDVWLKPTDRESMLTLWFSLREHGPCGNIY